MSINIQAMRTVRNTDRLLKRLAGKDLRSVGDADRVAKVACGDAAAIAELVRGLTVDDPVVRMRAADALEKATREVSGPLAPHKAVILEVLESSDQAEVRWQLVQCLPRLPFTHKELSETLRGLQRCFEHEGSRILRVNCLQALFDLAPRSPEGMDTARSVITEGLEDQAPSVRARARKLEKLLAGVARTGARP